MFVTSIIHELFTIVYKSKADVTYGRDVHGLDNATMHCNVT